MRLLGHEPHACEHVRRVCGDGVAQHGDATGERAEQSQGEADRRSLAGAVGAEEAVDRPGGDAQVEILDFERPAGAVVQLVDLDGVAHEVPTPISSAIAACSSGSDTPRRPASASSWRTSAEAWRADRKSTRLNSSHRCISYAV